jgi:hypothetical protein
VIVIKYTSEAIPGQPLPGTQNINARFETNSNRLIGWARAVAGVSTFDHTVTFSTPGSYTYTVPEGLFSLTAQVWGAGGGGGPDAGIASNGTAGSTSTFGSLSAGGGPGGEHGSTGGSGAGGSPASTASGGTTNTSGSVGGNTGTNSGAGGSNSAAGSGAGGAAVTTNNTFGKDGVAPGGGGSGGRGGGAPYGGGGGSGAYTTRTYTPAELTPGSSIPVTIGAGGWGNSGAFDGGRGAAGRVTITYTANGGWDGWIYLGDTGHGDGGIADTNGVLSGYVWGGDTVAGWVQLNSTVTPLCSDTEGYLCINSNTESQYTNMWCEVTTTPCTDGCNPTTGQCIVGAPASGDLCVGSLATCPDTTRVRSGQTATLYWDIQNASSCTVEGTNGDGGTGGGAEWNTVSQTAGVITSAITGSTRYTLTCISTDTSSFSDSVIINIVPVFREI